MKFWINQSTRYTYSTNVELSEHIIRMRPRSDIRQKLLSFNLSLYPEPSKIYDYIDPWGNLLKKASFDTPTDLLEINANMVVETDNDISGAMTIEADKLTLPLDYQNEKNALAPYLVLVESEQIMNDFIGEIFTTSHGHLLTCLDLLNKQISNFHYHGIRLEGNAQQPVETLRLQSGVCRDLAWLFIAACRQLGIASRFVSGFQHESATNAPSERYLHAWAEVYLPGLGWLGFDQTHGKIVSGDHVVVACGGSQTETMPVDGGYVFYGESIKSTLKTSINISCET